MNKLIAAFLLAPSLALACPPKDNAYKWTRSNRPDLPVNLNVVSQDVVNQHCKRFVPFLFTAYACAVYGRDVCQVYVTERTIKNCTHVLPHEYKHCQGYDHVFKGYNYD